MKYFLNETINPELVRYSTMIFTIRASPAIGLAQPVCMEVTG